MKNTLSQAKCLQEALNGDFEVIVLPMMRYWRPRAKDIVEVLNVFNPEQIVLYKNDLHYLMNYKDICCTLKDSIEFCNIQLMNKLGKPYLKYPKLSELHEKLFNKLPNNLHNSFIDILVTLRCFIKLKYDLDLNEKCISFKSYSDKLCFV